MARERPRLTIWSWTKSALLWCAEQKHIIPLVTLLVGAVGTWFARPLVEPFIQKKFYDYRIIYEKQSDAFQLLAEGFSKTRVYQNGLDEHKKGQELTRQSFILLSTYGYPYQIRALAEYLSHEYEYNKCSEYKIQKNWSNDGEKESAKNGNESFEIADLSQSVKLDVAIYQSIRSSLFKDEENFEEKNEEQACLAILIRGCILNDVKPGCGEGHESSKKAQ